MATAPSARKERASRRSTWIIGGLVVLGVVLTSILIFSDDGPEPPLDETAPSTAESEPFTADPGEPEDTEAPDEMPDASSAAPLPVDHPTWSSAQPYSEDSPWNTPLAEDAPVHERSEEFMARIGEGFTSDTSQYTLPVYEVGDETPLTEVRIIHLFSDVADDGTSVERHQQVTLDVPVPEGAVAATGTDAQIVIVNTDTGEEWGFWQFEPEGEGYSATNGYRYHVGWNAVPPEGFGSRGAGVPYLTGLIRPVQFEQGRIDHAIAFAYPTPSPDHVFPATKSDGQGDPELDLPEGARLRLDPTLDDDDFERMGLSAEGLIIARALQDYGMILIDVAGRPKIYAEYDATARWEGAITENTISSLPLESFEVIDWERADHGPLAQPTAPQSAPIGSDIVLDGSASYLAGGDADGEVTAFEWTDAQGRTVGDEAVVRYPSGDLEPGTHRFELRVAANAGSWSQPRRVYVTAEVETGPFIVTTYEGTGMDVDLVTLPAGSPGEDQSVVVAVVLRRLNPDDDVAVDDVVGLGRSWERIVREVDSRGALTLEIWSGQGPGSAPHEDELRVDVDGRTNIVVQAIMLTNSGPLRSNKSAHGDGRDGDPEVVVEGDAGDLVLAFHAGRTEDFRAETHAEVNVANTTVDDEGGSLRLSSLTTIPEDDGRVELSGGTRSPMDWAMAALAFPAAEPD